MNFRWSLVLMNYYICSVKNWQTAILIGVVTFATIGLMVIQVFWIRDAAKVKYSNFIRDVNEAMTHVVNYVDHQKIRHDLLNQQQVYSNNQKAFNTYDSLNKVLFYDLQKVSTERDFSKLMRRVRKTQSQLQDIIFDYQTGKTENHFLFDANTIDSLIAVNLKEKGIKTAYEFGVYDPFTNRMLLQKTGRYPQELLTESFAYDLAVSPGTFYVPEKLLIYFPNEQQFIIRQIWRLLSVSIVLFLIIIVSFYMTIQTIFRQKKLSEMKNDLINNMTHEFKTPISTIALACEALRDRDIQKSEDMYNSYISVISEENKRLGGMAEQILQQAVFSQGKMKLKKEVLDMHQIVEDAVNRKQLEVQAKEGSITISEKASESMVTGDKTHLTNTLINLLDNAIKYTLDTPKIVVNTINKRDRILIRVSDNGIGISKSNQKKIFEKLYRVHTGNVHDFKGFGLGLNYVKVILELHGGSVSVDSEPGKGSTFTISLPVEKIKNE